MSIVRVNKTKNYTVMSNVHLKDKNLTLKAKGLLSVVLSLPDYWDYSIAGLCAICKENTTAVKSALEELKQNGYLTITKKYPNETKTGRFEYVYDFYENKKQDEEKQDIENLHLENQPLENQTQLNNDKSNIKELSTEIIDYLNETAKKRYRVTPKVMTLISARLNEGFTLDDFKKVIKTKYNDWRCDDKMEKYIRPETLFGNKFDGYLNQIDQTQNNSFDIDEMFELAAKRSARLIENNSD